MALCRIHRMQTAIGTPRIEPSRAEPTTCARRAVGTRAPGMPAYFSAPATFFCRHRHSKSHATCAAAIAVMSA